MQPVGSGYGEGHARYPDEANLYASALKYKGSELRVPVELIYQGGGTGTLSLGFGGYYGWRFKTELPVSQTIRREDYGLSWEVGMKVGGTGLSLIWMSSLVPFFEGDAAPLVRESTALFRISKFF